MPAPVSAASAQRLPGQVNKMPRSSRIGQLPPRYRFALNPHVEARASRCPRCNALTYPRKFPLLIHVDPDELRVLGKTCKYCSRCEFIICHQDELEAELAGHFGRTRPEVVGNPYLVVGTVEMKAWRAGMAAPMTIDQMLAHAADFKQYLTLEYDPGGWGPAEEAEQRPKRRRRRR
jgi:hypothetical protein